MNLIPLNEATIALGRASFNQYRAAQMAGPGTESHRLGMHRETGRAVIIGAVLACVRNNMTKREEILNVTARVSRCTRSTVADVLDALTGDDADCHLWSIAHDRYYDLREVEGHRGGWSGALGH